MEVHFQQHEKMVIQKVVRLLVEKGADVVNGEGWHQNSALVVAAYEGHKDVVLLLIDKRADVNAESEFCENTLSAVSQKGHTKIMKLLIEKGADINRQGFMIMHLW